MKAAILKRVLPPNNETIVSVSQESGVAKATISYWKKQAADGILETGDGPLRPSDRSPAGEHRLTITADILGEEETLLERTVTVEEGASVALTLELPDIDVAGETAALEQRGAQERMDAAVRERDAAVAVADTLAAARMVTGRAYLARREYDEGVEIYRTVPELGARFNRDDLFGFRDEVGFVNYNWSEYEVQREQKPMPWLPVLVTGWALNFLFSESDSEEPYYQAGGAQSTGFPLVPGLMTAGLVSLWNSNDWDIPQRRRTVRAFRPPAPAARRAAETAWEASPLGVMADFGGLVGWGPRLGFEWNVTDGWALQLWARQHSAPDRLGIARTTTAVDYPVHDAVIVPGIAVRRYLYNRWYLGAQTEERVS